MSDGMADSDLTKPVYLSPADWQQLNRALEEGYKNLAGDPEMSRPNRKSFGYHCGFDFVKDQPTATCACGAVATNPFWVTKPVVQKEKTMTNNSNATTENIVNDNAVYNIVNQVVKCDCNTAKHDPADYECACEDCLDEQVDRLNEMLIQKAVQEAVQEDRERILSRIKWSNTQDLCGIIDDPSKCMRVIELLEKVIKEEAE